MPKTPGNLYGLYLKDDIALSDTLTLTPGLRYDRYEYKPRSGTSGYVLAGDSVMLTENKDSNWACLLYTSRPFQSDSSDYLLIRLITVIDPALAGSFFVCSLTLARQQQPADSYQSST